jgi:hypothetical protein
MARVVAATPDSVGAAEIAAAVGIAVAGKEVDEKFE